MQNQQEEKHEETKEEKDEEEGNDDEGEEFDKGKQDDDEGKQTRRKEMLAQLKALALIRIPRILNRGQGGCWQAKARDLAKVSQKERNSARCE